MLGLVKRPDSQDATFDYIELSISFDYLFPPSLESATNNSVREIIEFVVLRN